MMTQASSPNVLVLPNDHPVLHVHDSNTAFASERYRCQQPHHRNHGHSIFICYRVDPDQPFVSALATYLEKALGCNVFFDKNCLVYGQRWEQGFTDSLHSSTVKLVVVVLSRKGMEKFMTAHNDWDNQLMEIQLALHRNRVHKDVDIFPVLVGEDKVYMPPTSKLSNEVPLAVPPNVPGRPVIGELCMRPKFRRSKD